MAVIVTVGGDSLSATDMRDLWFEVKASVLRRFGHVSVAKFMGEADDEAAGHQWIDRAKTFFRALPSSVLRSASVVRGSPTVTFPSGLEVTFELGLFIVVIDGREVWRASLRPPAAVLIIEALGRARWVSEWERALAAIDVASGPAIPANDGQHLPWIAAIPPELAPTMPGPRTRAATERDAHRAARVEALGIEVVADVYERLAAE